MSRLPTRRLLVLAGILAAAALAVAWLYPSSHYLFVPNPAQPLAERVEVEGGTDPADGGIHFVDVTIRKASLLERLVPGLRPGGSTIVAQDALFPDDSSLDERRERGRAEMERSQQIAAAVALEAAGKDVDATPRGVLVEGVATDVPAAGTLEEGDEIVAVESVAVRTPAALRREIEKAAPGDELQLAIRRGDAARAVVVETIAAPDDPERTIIGIQVGQAADIDLPLDVEIDLGSVGGPSAGLAFALQILEELGQDVDRGNLVAATGQLELDGSVVPVGGIKQKTFGAIDAGADVFLVPAGDNAAEARRYADGLRVVPVKSFQQTLRVLATLPQKN